MNGCWQFMTRSVACQLRTVMNSSVVGRRTSVIGSRSGRKLAALSSYGLMWSVTSNIMGCLRCQPNPKCTTVTSARPRCRTSTASSCAPGVAIRETAPIRNPMTVRVQGSGLVVSNWWLVVRGRLCELSSGRRLSVIGERR